MDLGAHPPPSGQFEDGPESLLDQALAGLSPDWHRLGPCLLPPPVGGSDWVRVPYVLLHSELGIVLVEIEPAVTPDAVQRLRLCLAAELDSAHRKAVPVLHLGIAPSRTERLGRALEHALAQRLAAGGGADDSWVGPAIAALRGPDARRDERALTGPRLAVLGAAVAALAGFGLVAVQLHRTPAIEAAGGPGPADPLVLTEDAPASPVISTSAAVLVEPEPIAAADAAGTPPGPPLPPPPDPPRIANPFPPGAMAGAAMPPDPPARLSDLPRAFAFLPGLPSLPTLRPLSPPSPNLLPDAPPAAILIAALPDLPPPAPPPPPSAPRSAGLEAAQADPPPSAAEAAEPPSPPGAKTGFDAVADPAPAPVEPAALPAPGEAAPPTDADPRAGPQSAAAPAPAQPPAVQAEPVPQPAAPAEARPRMAPAAVEALLRRGDRMLALGDVSAARLLYARAAAEGSGAAALALGRTHDPAELARLGVRGLRPDPEEAARWYRQAAELGEPAAAPLLRGVGR
ncbi:hypothetical protein [Falsiroseomonas sp. HW251]|uniref:hypothetical protein n=1 Tax=Falsiroseomonas sp. HW251 TaxID=3390998 RepID=UPI003D319097